MAKLRTAAVASTAYLNGSLNPWVQCVSASQGSGEAGLPHATFVIEHGLRNPGRSELQDVSLIDFNQHELEILTGTRVTHFGIVSSRQDSLNDSGTFTTWISRVEPHLFGFPLKEAYCYNPLTSSELAVDLPTIFNSELDDVIVPNLSQKRAEDSYGLFAHPETTRTEAARKYAGSPKPKFWTLPEAVFYLCWTLNAAEDSFKNPTLAALKAVLPADENLLRNFECDFGEYLPAQLDAILEPYGFTWTIDLEGRGAANRKIRVYNRNLGPAAEIDLQPVGETADLNKSNIKSLSLATDVSSGAFNSIWLVGEFERYEATFELVRGWKKEQDDIWAQDDDGIANLSKDAPGWTEDSTLADVWRRWVLNEGGDYIGTRDSVDKPHDFDELFGKGNWIPRRRKFLPCLSREDNGEPRGHVLGVFIEYSTDAGETWMKLDQLQSVGSQCQVLETECGINFNGAEPPDELRLAGNDARVRVTACVESDARIGRRERTLLDKSVSKKLKNLYINAASKFKYRQRDDSSIFNGYLTDVFTEDEIESDDSAIMKNTSETLLKQFDVGSVQGEVTLCGCDYPNLKIGQTFRGIVGRKVNAAVSNDGAKFPSIIGLTFNFQDQTTGVAIGSYRGPLRL